MSCQESSYQNKVTTKINGYPRAFIDENLQLHLPGKEESEKGVARATIHVHTLRSSSKDKKEEYEELFIEAEKSFEKWKKLRDLISSSCQKKM